MNNLRVKKFEKTINRIESHNANKKSSYKLGLNKNTDLLERERKNMFGVLSKGKSKNKPSKRDIKYQDANYEWFVGNKNAKVRSSNGNLTFFVKIISQ